MAIQSLLFNPDLSPMQYIAQQGTFELTLDEKFKTFWLSQKQIAELFNLTQQAVSHHVKNFKEARSDEPDSVYKKFRYTADDGKSYDVEHYNHNVVIYIGYRAQATPQTIHFQRFVEEVFRQRLEAEHVRAMHKAQHMRAADVTSYVLKGLSPSHAEKRVDMKSTFKQLSAIIKDLTDAQTIGAVVSKEYRMMFGKVADELKIILHTKSIRDALPEMQLDYLDLMEKNMIRVLSHKGSMSRAELLATAEKAIKPLADNLKEMCEVMGIDPVTGRKLLGRGS